VRKGAKSIAQHRNINGQGDRTLPLRRPRSCLHERDFVSHIFCACIVDSQYRARIAPTSASSIVWQQSMQFHAVAQSWPYIAGANHSTSSPNFQIFKFQVRKRCATEWDAKSAIFALLAAMHCVVTHRRR
jgi:hypothetical protein